MTACLKGKLTRMSIREATEAPTITVMTTLLCRSGQAGRHEDSLRTAAGTEALGSVLVPSIASSSSSSSSFYPITATTIATATTALSAKRARTGDRGGAQEAAAGGREKRVAPRQQPARPASSSSSQPQRPSRLDGKALVVRIPELVGLMTGFLAGPSVEGRRQLGKVALVCRLWRKVAVQDEYWRPIVRDLLLEARTGPEERLQGGARGEVMGYGRCLVQRRIWVGEEWWSGLRLGIDILDKMDGLRMYSASGRLWVGPDEQTNRTRLYIKAGPQARQVAGPAFSAASRDPEQRRFLDVGDYIGRALWEDSASRFCMRLTATDEKRGRVAVLSEREKVGFLSDGSSRRSTIIGAPQHSLQFGACLNPTREPGQKAVPVVDMRYRLSTGTRQVSGVDVFDNHFYVSSVNQEEIRDFFMTLLA